MKQISVYLLLSFHSMEMDKKEYSVHYIERNTIENISNSHSWRIYKISLISFKKINWTFEIFMLLFAWYWCYFQYIFLTPIVTKLLFSINFPCNTSRVVQNQLTRISVNWKSVNQFCGSRNFRTVTEPNILVNLKFEFIWNLGCNRTKKFG